MISDKVSNCNWYKKIAEINILILKMSKRIFTTGQVSVGDVV